MFICIFYLGLGGPGFASRGPPPQFAGQQAVASPAAIRNPSVVTGVNTSTTQATNPVVPPATVPTGAPPPPSVPAAAPTAAEQHLDDLLGILENIVNHY